jgi:hypothetical protein
MRSRPDDDCEQHAGWRERRPAALPMRRANRGASAIGTIRNDDGVAAV